MNLEKLEESDCLKALVKAGIVYQDSDGRWYIGVREDTDLTPRLLKAGLLKT